MMLTTEPLLEAIDLLGEVKAGVELVCTDSIADMRLLSNRESGRWRVHSSCITL